MVFSCGQLSSILSTHVIVWLKLGDEIRRSSLKASSYNVTGEIPRYRAQNLRERNSKMIQCLLSDLNWMNSGRFCYEMLRQNSNIYILEAKFQDFILEKIHIVTNRSAYFHDSAKLMLMLFMRQRISMSDDIPFIISLNLNCAFIKMYYQFLFSIKKKSNTDLTNNKNVRILFFFVFFSTVSNR